MEKIYRFVLFSALVLSSGGLAGLSAAQSSDPTPEPVAPDNPSPTNQSNELQKAASWRLPNEKLAAESLRDWMSESVADESLALSTVEAFQRMEQTDGESSSGNDSRLDRVIRAIASVRPDVAKIAKQLAPQSQTVLPPTFSHILDNDSEHPFVREHVRLLFGRWLVQNKFYDESLEELNKIQLDKVTAPESVLFYRSIAQHQLLKSDECKISIEKLLEHETALPSRYSVVAKMMLADIAPVKDGSLDEISRLMKDIQRRTRFLRSGVVVLETEEQVIEKLDKLIEEAEKKQQQQQQQQAQSQSQPGNGQQQGSKPMEDTQIAGGTGDGKVTNKSIQDGGQWGDLPAAERAAAMAEMVKDMPPHYRTAIEQYFRRLAKEDSP